MWQNLGIIPDRAKTRIFNHQKSGFFSNFFPTAAKNACFLSLKCTFFAFFYFKKPLYKDIFRVSTVFQFCFIFARKNDLQIYLYIYSDEKPHRRLLPLYGTGIKGRICPSVCSLCADGDSFLALPGRKDCTKKVRKSALASIENKIQKLFHQVALRNFASVSAF